MLDRAPRSLRALPTVRCGLFPTPIQPLPWLSRRIGRRVIAKRDDLSGLALGGNKTRKLEYLVADALAQGCDTLMATGFIQSNNVVQTAAAAALHGLAAVLCLDGVAPNDTGRGNVLLGHYYGAELVFTNGRPVADVYRALVDSVTARGAKPYVLPPGGSTGIGIAGFVAAVAEATAQLAEARDGIDTLVFPTGTGGTQAGLLLGADLLGWPIDILGISTGKTAAEMRPAILAMIDEAAAALGVSHGVTAARVLIDETFYGAGYARPDGDDFEALRALARHDGLLCDPVYNARAMKGLIALADRGALPGTGDILYWHTGGTPALFAFDAPQETTRG